jgi:hypothetical protein
MEISDPILEISGPVEVAAGWVFALQREAIQCCDAPVAVYNWEPKAEAAFNWAKANFADLFYPNSNADVFYLGIPNYRDALQFKLMWM